MLSSHALAIASILAADLLGSALILAFAWRADRKQVAEREQAEREDAEARRMRLAA